MATAFEVKVSRREEDSSYKARVCKVCCFGKDPSDVLDIDRVSVSERDPVYCPNTDDRSYSVYVIADDIQQAKDAGINLIKEYRSNNEDNPQ